MEETNLNPNPNWPKAKLTFFRFLCAYLILYNLPFPLRNIPYLAGVSQLYKDASDLFVIWVGKNILRISDELPRLNNGSGDTIFNYAEILVFFLIAMAIAFIWSLRDR
ncbi:MAG: hypothetical protein FD167_6213, partial [bacterium]